MDLITLAPLGVASVVAGIVLRIAGRSWEKRQSQNILAMPAVGPIVQIERGTPKPIQETVAALPPPPPPPPLVLALSEDSDEKEKQEAFEQFRKLEEIFTADIYAVLCISKSEEDTRKFFEKCLKKAQQRWADEHADEIMNAVMNALTTANVQAQADLNKKKRILEAIERIARE